MLVIRKFSNDRKFYIEVHTQDEGVENPLQESPWDGHISLCSRYACYGTEYGTRECLDVDEFAGYARIRFEGIRGGVRIPVYAYEHSGITFNTCGCADRWDSGVAGWAWMEADKVREMFGGNREQAREYLRDMVKTLDAYVRGECYGYEVYNAESGECVDSCYGFLNTQDTTRDFLQELADSACFDELADACNGEIDEIDE